MTQYGQRKFRRLMKQIILITLLALVATPGAFAQSDEELIETVRTSAKEGFLEEPFIPESFQENGLSPSDKERILEQLASDSADCLADTTVEYSALFNVSIPDMVSSDGTIGPRGDSAGEFTRMLNDCIVLAWQAAGVNIAGYLE